MIDGWVAGVDVARHQPPDQCDWEQAQTAGVDFAFVKLSEGADYIDPAAGEHIKRLRRAGLPFGVYHLSRPDWRFDKQGMDARAAGLIEAEHFLKCYEAAGLCGQPFALDQEKRTSVRVTDAQRCEFVLTIAEKIESELGPQIVYSGDEYWRAQLRPDLAVELRSRGWLLWLATYTRRQDPPENEIIPGWPWSIWQWSGGGKGAIADPVPGLPSPIDMNRYRGSIEELSALWSRTVMGARW